ncbi:MAG: beta-phosphoglucomutase [Desulfobacterales bacterium C00003106]|jgi:HAD superfamily hydrolase (TIGR01549 family)|nr:MAG: beta-phosphoglucomutase [Desulfobacterales bacterium C00003106]
MNRVKAVIFDCDGVMFDSRGANEAYYNQILKRFDMKEMDADESDFTHMHTVEESIAHIFRDAPGLVGPAHGYRRDMSYIPFIAHMKMHPYLITFLQYLRPAYKTAISTNRTDTMKHVLATHGLETYFDLVVSALDVSHPKPHPESLEKILDHFEIMPKDALYIGDSEVDEAASAAAGVPLVAYQNKSLEAEYYIEHFKELEEIIEGYS